MGERVRVLITGGTGMIGTWLAGVLRERGNDVLVLTRQTPKTEHQVQWDPTKAVADPERLAGVQVVYNLAGAPIADRPWTRARRKVLIDSRVRSTKVLLESLQQAGATPHTFIGAGGLGRFGDGGERVLTDDDPPGTGFLAELATAWEAAHFQARALGCRTAVLRMGIVLSPTGGAFPLMIKPFRLGLGGWLGNGQQWTSWLTIRDAVAALLFLQDHPECEGAYNGSVPEPVRNKAWSKALGRVLNRPVITHAPKWILRGALGELADGLFLASLRTVPKRLLQAGYTFVDPDIEPAFRWLVQEQNRRAK